MKKTFLMLVVSVILSILTVSVWATSTKSLENEDIIIIPVNGDMYEAYIDDDIICTPIDHIDYEAMGYKTIGDYEIICTPIDHIDYEAMGYETIGYEIICTPIDEETNINVISD